MYNDIIEIVEGWKKNFIEDSIMKSEVNTIIQKIDFGKEHLEVLKNGIDLWQTSRLIRDINSYRSIFKTKTDLLIIDLESLKGEIQNIQTKIIEKIEFVSRDTSISELDEMLMKIYALESFENETEVDSITNIIDSLLVDNLKNDFFGEDNVRTLTSLKKYLMLYSEYLKLKNSINMYITDRLEFTYQIIKDDTTLENQENYIVRETEWIDNRNYDFNIFCKMIEMLPMLNEEENLERGYIVSEVLKEASVMQRDLLGQLTEFERAFNYFKYNFPVMAYFSAFIAVFFDLGAFFVGCYIYNRVF